MPVKTLAVTAALMRQGNKVLLAQRLPQAEHANQWEFPGGKVEFGENPSATIAREMAEELGMQVVVRDVFDVFSHVNERGLHILLIVYNCEPGGIPPTPLACQDVRWVTLDEACAYDLPPLDKQILSRIQKGPVL